MGFYLEDTDVPLKLIPYTNSVLLSNPYTKGIRCYKTNLTRIPTDKIPEGMYRYGVRSIGGSTAYALEKYVYVNHLFEILTDKPIDYLESSTFPYYLAYEVSSLYLPMHPSEVEKWELFEERRKKQEASRPLVFEVLSAEDRHYNTLRKQLINHYYEQFLDVQWLTHPPKGLEETADFLNSLEESHRKIQAKTDAKYYADKDLILPVKEAIATNELIASYLGKEVHGD